MQADLPEEGTDGPQGRRRSTVLFAPGEELDDRSTQIDQEALRRGADEDDLLVLDAPLSVTSADEHYTRGIACIRGRDFAPAIHHFSKAIFLSPGEPLPYVARAEAFTHLCDLRSAIANFRKALSMMRDPVAAEDLRMRLAQVLDTQGIACFRSNNVTSAMRFFDESLEEHDQPIVRLHRCLGLISLGERIAAAEQLSALAHDAEVEADATVLLVHLQIERNDFAGARSLLEGVLYRFHDHPRVLDTERAFDTSFNEFKQRAERELSVDALSACIAAFPEDAELYRVRAISHANRKSYTLAVQDLFTCINKCGGTNAEAAALMATVLCTIADELAGVNDLVAAANYYTEALKWDESQLPVYVARGDCYTLLGKHEQALDDFKRVLDADPHDEDALFRLARLHDTWGSVLYNQGKYDMAEAEYTRALTYCATNLTFFYHRALARLMLQQPVLAVRDLISCRDLGPTDPDILRLVNQFCVPHEVVDDAPRQSSSTGHERQRAKPRARQERTPLPGTHAAAVAGDTAFLRKLRSDQSCVAEAKLGPSAIRSSARLQRIAECGSVRVVRQPNGDVLLPEGTEKRQLRANVVWAASSAKPPSRLDRAQVSPAEPIPRRYRATGCSLPSKEPCQPGDGACPGVAPKVIHKPSKLRPVLVAPPEHSSDEPISCALQSSAAPLLVRAPRVV